MTPEKKYRETRALLDKLKSERNADTNKAELEIALLAKDKAEQHYMSSMTGLWFNICILLGIDAERFYNDYKDEE